MVEGVGLVVEAEVARIKAGVPTRVRNLHNDLLTPEIAATAHVSSCLTRAREAHFTSGS